MSIVKPKVSSLVAGQLPAFIREDYQTFVAFIEAYYEFLEQNTITDFDTIGDIDTTLDSFIKYFKNELASNFPTLNTDDRFLIPKLKELYSAKGTEAAFKLVFRLLYNKDVTVSYPSTQMLRVSDGKWIQQLSVFSTINIGTPDLIVGKYVNIVSTDKTNLRKVRVFVDSYRTTTDPNIYEFFLLSGFTGTFSIGDLLNYGTVFTGVIQATTTNLSVIQPGKNFKVGQTYDIAGSGTSSVVKVTSIDINGGIKTAKFISYGTGYPTAFTTNILAYANQTSNVQNFFTISGISPSYTATISDSMDQITDEGVLNIYNYALTAGAGLYVDSTYVGTIAQSFVNTVITTTTDPADYAVLSITLGPLAKYPGYYKNNDGFISDTIYIQDSKYYQAFSYAIQIDELFESYKSVLKNIVHPAGTEMFGEYGINNTFNINATAIVNTLVNITSEAGTVLITEAGDTLVAPVI